MVVMLAAYFDASARQSGVFSVAGVAFGIDRAKKAEREWRSIFGDRRCHMTDLHARKREFLGVSDKGADQLCRAAIRTIATYATIVISVSCDIDEVARLTPRDVTNDALPLADALRSAYNCCLHWAMHAMGSATSQAEHIQYWFELGDEYQGAARRFLTTLNDSKAEPLRRAYSYGSDAFVSKADARLFEVPDVVAWEWAKNIDRFREGKNSRPSLEALMGGPCLQDNAPGHHSVGRYARHFTGAPLERFFRKMGAVMAATSTEEVQAAIDES